MNETINLISQIASNNLFPIIACFYMYKQNVKLTDSIGELSTTLKLIDSRLDQIENVKGV